MIRRHHILFLVTVVAVSACGPRAPVVTAPPEPADAVPWPELVWAKADLPAIQVPGTEHLAAVAADDAGFVAVGFREEAPRRDGVILFSPDGGTWQRVDLGLMLGALDLDLVDVAAGPGGFVAVGSASMDGRPTTTVALRSADGRSWEREALPEAADTYVYSVAAGPAGYLASGNTASGGGASWVSADGTTWQRAPTEALGAGTGGIIDPRADGAGWMALGSNGNTPLFLRSTDGIGWEATVIGSPDEYASRLVAGRWGYVVQGGEGRCGLFSMSCGGTTFTWWSGDGKTWTRLRPEGALASGGITFADAGDRGLIGLDGLSAWSSTTGWSWTAMPPPGDGSAALNAAVVRSDVIVAVGEQYLPDGRSVGRIVVAE